jgi:hypothetical protein
MGYLLNDTWKLVHFKKRTLESSSSSSYMALQPISGFGLLFMRFRNLTLIDGW